MKVDMIEGDIFLSLEGDDNVVRGMEGLVDMFRYLGLYNSDNMCN